MSYNKKGILIYNESLTSEKFNQLHQWYVESAKEVGIELVLTPNTAFDQWIHHNTFEVTLDTDFILFLDKDILLAKLLEQTKIPLFNRSDVIRICDDKRLTYVHFVDQGIPLIETIFAPLCFKHHQGTAFKARLVEKLGFPMVMKAAFGSFGEQVFLLQNQRELDEKYEEYAQIPHLYQRFVSEAAGVDRRIFAVGGNVVCALQRENKHDFRANVTKGGTMQVIEVDARYHQLTKQISDCLQADFLGIDFLEANGEILLCEVNSNAHSYNAYLASGINVAKAIFHYIEETLHVSRNSVL